MNEEQKECFFKYAYKLATVDGQYTKSEEEMLLAYCDEMHVPFNVEAEKANVEELLEKLNSVCGEQEKKIVLFEAIGLALVDNKYDESESKMLKAMVQKFDLEMSFKEDAKKYVEEYIQLQAKINTLVLGA